MKKYSYAGDFNNVADVARIGNADDVKISYAVFVGDPDSKGDRNFNGGESFAVRGFTTRSDAVKAKMLASLVLQQVDENLEYGLKLSDVRDEVLAAVAKKFDVDGDPEDHDLLNLRPAVEHAIKRIFDYYISVGN